MTIATKGAAAKFLGSKILGGAAAGAAGSIASQSVGLATGIQDKFSFKGVALAAVGGGVGGALGEGGGIFKDGVFSGVKSSAVQAGLQGALGSALTQGIATATGLQSNFSFAGVAAAGVGALAGGALGGALKGSADSFGNQLATHTASAIANAATRSAIEGSSFGQNILNVIPDVIGQAVGGALGRAVAGGQPDISYDPKKLRDYVNDSDFDGLETPQQFEAAVAARLAEASGNPEAFREELQRSRALQRIVRLEADMVYQFRNGVAIPDSRAGLIGLGKQRSVELLDGGEIIISESRGFGDKVAQTGIELYGYYDSQSESTKTLIDLSLAGLRGGPVGAGISYVADQAVGAALSATGADQVIGEVVKEVGVYGLSGLSNSGVSEERGYAADGYNGPAYLVGATATILGLTALGKAVLDYRKSKTDAPPNTTFLPTDFPGIGRAVSSQKQGRHVLGHKNHTPGKGYFDTESDAQMVLDAFHSGDAQIIGTRGENFPVVRFDGVTGTNVNRGAGISGQATNVFYIKGLDNPSIVPINPEWRP